MSIIKVLLVGPYPPPYGGLAVQLCEWQRYLSEQSGYQCRVLNIGEFRDTTIDGCVPTFGYWDFIRKLYKHCSENYLIHLLTNGHNARSWLSACGCALVGMRNRRRTVLVFGSGNAPEYIKNAGPFMTMVIRTSLRLGGYFICRNSEMREALIQCGAESERIALLPGFLGLNNNDCQRDVPDKIEAFLKEHDPVLGATANLDPEYGIEFMLEAMEELRTRYPSIGLLIIGPDEDSRTAFTKASNSIHFTGQLSNQTVLAVMSRFTLFLRATYFDGDSISVREALSLGVPVVASNVGYRPEGVHLFPKGNRLAMIAQITKVLNGPGNVSAPLGEGAAADSIGELLNIYQQLAGRRS